MKQVLRQTKKNELGVTMLPLALCMIAMIGVAGLATDAVIAYMAKAMLRTSVDSAVMAAVQVQSSQRNTVADRVFYLNYPTGYMSSTGLSHSGLVVSGNIISLTGTVDVPTYFTHIFGHQKMNVKAFAEAETIPPAPTVLLMDEDALDNGLSEIITLSGNPTRCGNSNPAKCVNDDIAGLSQRQLLFTRGINITPYTGLTLTTGQTGDEGLFAITRSDPQVSQQGTPSFTTQQLLNATGPAANENNLDKITGVRGLTKAQVEALVGKTVCALVWDSDISYDASANYSVLKGATMGLTAFVVTSTTPRSGSYLPKITIDLLPSDSVGATCAEAMPGVPSLATSQVSFLRR